jgi:hypothetical protein
LSLRVQQGLSTRLYLDVYSTAGGPKGSVSPTVTITRLSTGAALVTAASATAGDTTGSYYYDLPASCVDLIDTLTVVWSFTADSVAQTQTDTVDVVGNRLAPHRLVDDSLNRGGTSGDYNARKAQIALSVAENLFEGATNKAWTTRFGRTTLDGPNWWRGYTYRRAHFLVLPVYPVTALRSVTVNSTVQTTSDYTLYPDGRVYSPTSWSTGHQNVVIDYEYGEAQTPLAVQRAVAILASSILADGPWDDRGFGATTDGGFVHLLTAGVGGALFSIPEVQSAVKSFGRQNAERILAVDVG